MTMFPIIHDRRGATAFEFTLVLIPLLMFIFGIVDASRYALTWRHSSGDANLLKAIGSHIWSTI
jgi:hypothetical protein